MTVRFFFVCQILGVKLYVFRLFKFCTQHCVRRVQDFYAADVICRNFCCLLVTFAGRGVFFNANQQAAPLRNAFLWFKNTLEVIFPDQPLEESSLLRYKVCKEKVFEDLDLRTQQKLNIEMVLFTPFMLENLPHQDEQQKVGSPKNEIYYSTVIRNRRNIFIITSENDKMFHFYAKKFVHNIGGNKIEFSLEDKQVHIDKVLDQNYMDNVWGGVPVFEDER